MVVNTEYIIFILKEGLVLSIPTFYFMAPPMSTCISKIYISMEAFYIY